MKIFSILAAVGLAMSLAACGSSSDGGGDNSPVAPNPGSGGGNAADVNANPVGKPGPAGAFSCYISVAAESSVTCIDVPAVAEQQKEQAKGYCLQQTAPGVEVVWNDVGCSQDKLVGTCLHHLNEGLTMKMRYYKMTEEQARGFCMKLNPQNSFTTTY